MLPTLTHTSRVRLRPLVVRFEDGEYVVGSVDNGEFVELPAVGKRAIEMLNADLTLAEIQTRLQREFDVTVDLPDFVDQLSELGFVAEVDGQPVPGLASARAALPWLRPHHVAWMLSWPAAVVYVAMVLTATVLLIVMPQVRPYGGNLVRLPLISAVIGVVMVGFMVVIALHELGHLIAARALGLPARVSLTTRLYFITARTEVPSLWAVPRRKRHLVYLSGMAADLLVLSLAVIVASLWVPSRPWMGVVMALTAFNMIIQLQLYMRTDLYLVAAELARSKNLFQDSANYLRHRLGRLRDRLARRPARTGPDPLIALPAHSRKAVRRYAVVMAVGTVLSLAFYLLVLLPAMVGLAVTSIETIYAGIADTHEHHPGHDLHVVDGVLTLALQLSLLTLFVRTWWRQRRTRLATTPAAQPTHHNQ